MQDSLKKCGWAYKWMDLQNSNGLTSPSQPLGRLQLGDPEVLELVNQVWSIGDLEVQLCGLWEGTSAWPMLSSGRS